MSTVDDLINYKPVKITDKNCKEICIKKSGDESTACGAWKTVREFCLQNGMRENSKGNSGIEQVIYFLQRKLAKPKK